jgi:tetratricopeptide (TPR) repeat protein
MGARLFMTCATGLLLAALIGSPAAADDRQICHEEQPARRPDDVKDWDSVIQACSRIISSRAVRGGQLADAYFVRGIQYEERRDYDRALEDFSAAIWLEPKSARYLFYRAHVYKYNKRDPDRALADLSEAIRLASDNALYLRSRGELYEGKRQWDNALADYRAALSVDPNDRPARDQAAA